MTKRSTLEALVGQPVRVVWVDAVGISEGWSHVDDLKNAQLPVCETLSFLVHVSQRALHLASSRINDGTIGGTSLIPLKWIERVEPLGLV